MDEADCYWAELNLEYTKAVSCLHLLTNDNKTNPVNRVILKPFHPALHSHQIIVDGSDLVLAFVMKNILSGYSPTLAAIEGEYCRGIS